MLELHALLILFFAGVAGGIMNVMAGGGSTITLPALILLGLDAGVANGTNRVAILIQNISATLTFSSQKKTRIRKSVSYALWTIPGAISGAFMATRIEDALFEKILAGLLIVVVLTMLVPRENGASDKVARKSVWTGPALLLIGFYGGFVQIGVGFLFMAVFFHLLHLDLLTTTVHKVTVILLYTGLTLFVFAILGKVDWGFGLTLAAGNATGAFIAAKVAIRRGEKVIRGVMVVAVLIMALRILGLV
ncbi:MAG: sulfite exporter TauE/SafE family protein [Bacteroidota bacterium]|nr:sulfite exporter TauE/SafE family protein [Bacteroidota bacterium]MXW15326.1 sulfite exporter TauE/SafE family protein [Rhodothermaceae bacterium]MDE2645672.1 sulfite exporter TauE/SafE family protein [Bacteroidota bacterium]MXW33219.1 sulfite exporter TauE/SafE family protein [Rhodothermaceae bacterium]MXZ17547.1 sulfite exporter TauE/SafE family protein [Rhodothermaceae bacterium]